MSDAEENVAAVVDEAGTIHLPARSIPLPAFLSPEAKRLLSFAHAPRTVYPPLHDREAWRVFIAEHNERSKPMFEAMLERALDRASVESTSMNGVTVEVGTPNNRRGDRVWVNVHGGSLVNGAGITARTFAGMLAAQWGNVIYAVDYRVPPDHPYPAAIDDVVAVYRSVLEDHPAENIVVNGMSSGGNTASAAVLKARDLGLPLPGALVLETPEIDLTESGDSFHTLRDLDPMLGQGLPETIALYADGHDLAHPYLSPLFADFGRGFPPTYIQSGTRDIFLSNAVRLHRALRNAEIDAELHVWDGALHVGFGIAGIPVDAPESAEMQTEQARFLNKHVP
ncbi:alpha/beta hydrolase [Subtercola sp. YIM 133946]|uniref:alpha/beta hydrolase n=1 Tax=Subtercola sp. YIM 133946 TaxID=3118909 RepID=UPI002F933288